MRELDCLQLYEDAEFYDAEFATRDLEVPFYRRWAAKAKGAVLEVACGTGRLTLPIARDGVKVTGLDVSQPMVERARQKATAEGLEVEWLVQDCRTMQLPERYALIFSATNAMQHLLDVESVCVFLESARRGLAPEGLFILDVFHPDFEKLARPSSIRYLHKTIVGPGGQDIRVEVSSAYQPVSQVLHFDLFYLRAEQVLRTKHVNMRCFFPEELLALCRSSGLEVVERFGDYDESPFAEKSPKQILVCRRAEG